MKHFIYLAIMIAASFAPVHLFSQTFTDAGSLFSVSPVPGTAYFGTGASFADFDGDGWDDITFTTGPNQAVWFFKNNAGTFQSVNLIPSMTCTSKSAVWADYDNDGDKDLFVTCLYEANHLYNNDGNLNLTDVSVSSGIVQQTDNSFGISWGDYNNDGWLDIYVSNQNALNNCQGCPVYSNNLMKNNGDGTFTDVTASSNAYVAPNYSFCSVFFDMNNNGYQDIYVAVDKTYNNVLLKNMGDGTFTDISSVSGAGIVIDAMSTGMGDYNNDGFLDLYITNTITAPYSVLLQNNGDETFTNVATSAGVDFPYLGWGANFFDCNNDRNLDLYVCTVTPSAADGLFINMGNSTFYSDPIPGDMHPSFSLGTGDIENDGLPDIAESSFGSNPNKLWENNYSGPNNYLKVELEGVQSNRDGIGSWIEVYIGGQKYVRYTTAGINYMGQNSFTEIIGLGTAMSVDSLKIKWLSGIVDVFYNVPGNQKLNIVEGSSFVGLPIELTNIMALPISEYISIRWSTESETSFKGFELQRADNGANFQSIAWIEGTGNRETGAHYQYSDENVLFGKTYYYRLKSVDLDASFSYSQIVSAKLEFANNTGWSFHPNPISTSNPRIEITTPGIQNGVLQLLTIDGKMVFEQRGLNLDPGIHKLEYPLLPGSGSYFLSVIENGKSVFAEKILVLE